MNEIGLDPGIDHLYAVRTIDEVHKEGGKVIRKKIKNKKKRHAYGDVVGMVTYLFV